MQGKNQVSLYKDFKDFFDYEKRIADVEKPKAKPLNEEHKRLARLAAKINSKGG